MEVVHMKALAVLLTLTVSLVTFVFIPAIFTEFQRRDAKTLGIMGQMAAGTTRRRAAGVTKHHSAAMRFGTQQSHAMGG